MEAVRLARNNTESKCTVLFFDEIDALGQSRGGSGGSGTTSGKAPLAAVGSGQSGGGGGGDTSSRRVLAELLIQLTKVNASHGNYDLLVPENNEKDQQGSGDGDDDTSMTTIMDIVEEDNKQEYHRHNSEEEDGNSIDSDERTVCGDTVMKKEEESERQRRQAGSRATCDDHNDNENSVRVIVVAATNRPEDCDPALIRRFAVQVNVGLPTKKDRKKILKQNMKEIEHTITKKQFSDLAAITDGWSGSDLESLAREAAMAPVRECIRSAALMKRRRLLSNPKQGGKQQQQQQQQQHRRQQGQQPKNKKTSDGVGAAHLQGENKENQINTNYNHHTNEMVDDDDSFVRSRERLLEEFRNLRLVDIRDYKRALYFLFIRMYPNIHDSPLTKFGWIPPKGNLVGLNEHYDSSSDEEDEEEDDQHEDLLV
ncbi:MAG: SpoVK/Ycf46/Vps4 family AAA+-type ATPase [Bacillariaceae sp.]|jgi:SpoVK/Ycf46/Vps4 family AAA+-type ATPase